MGSGINRQEFDACAVYAAVRKYPDTTSPTPLWHNAIEALGAMEHRSGNLDGKSDGTGIITDLPLELWQDRLSRRSITESSHPRVSFLSLVLSLGEERHAREVLEDLGLTYGFSVWEGHWDAVDAGQGLWSTALVTDQSGSIEHWRLIEDFEVRFPGQLAAFGSKMSVLKMRVDARTLAGHAQKLWGDHFRPRVVVGHNRFSTNTTTELRRVQPFLWLAHNGEINTIGRVRREFSGLGFNPVNEGSDSQTLDRALMQFSQRFHLSLAETMRLISAPSPAVVKTWPEEWQAAYQQLEVFWPPVVQGPQALVATDGNQLVASVDALGLRPLWILETEQEIILSSEAGVVNPTAWVAEPRMIGPGEVRAWSWNEKEPVKTLDEDSVMVSLLSRFAPVAPAHHAHAVHHVQKPAAIAPGIQASDGWTRDDQEMVKAWVRTNQEPIGSLGFDGPLAALSSGITTISDYLHETVAVVTNPALDREREAEHFRLNSWLGARPFQPGASGVGPVSRLDHPWLTDSDLMEVKRMFGKHYQEISLTWPPEISELDQARAIGRKAVALVEHGATVLVLTDQPGYQDGVVTLDPVLAMGAVDQALLSHGLLRHTSVIVKSGMIRNLHDSAVLLGLGAAALVPHLLFSEAGDTLPITTLCHGLEKIFSTMGTHWLCGYGRNFSAIGLSEDVAELLGIASWASVSPENWERRRATVRQERLDAIQNGTKPRFISHFNPHVYKAAHQLTQGAIDTGQYHAMIRDRERQMPTQLRHVLVMAAKAPRRSGPVSLKVGDHALPFVISSMSFGSQGESAFRAYAEAARRLNILAMNGEGGEIPDMIGRYVPWRGHQVASGRFGINAALLNGAAYAEIKIGQGAKPGEGGHLPGKKVSEKVARARNARPGVDLISPSNNHDLYSIEDLRQLIDELKMVNPRVKVVVKVPIVPNIGTIAVGIVKAGADVITLSGFDGGTGAARAHALRHVGLPADVGVPLTHQTLVAAGVRDRVELWADGGVRAADDVIKLILLGANRVGFGTMAMVALGCTICRQCQKDTCHVGITTQIGSIEEAQARGLKRFSPQEVDTACEHLVTFFRALGQELEEGLRHLGVDSVASAVGQWQWLKQWGAKESLDFTSWLWSLAEDSESLLVARADGSTEVTSHYELPSVPVEMAPDRRLGGVFQAGRRYAGEAHGNEAIIADGVAGQGFGAFSVDGITCLAHGGAQDGVGKGALGGHIWIMKSGHLGGHAGKSLAYGAQGGVIVVQGGCDSRAGVRLAGGRVVIMGEGLPEPGKSQAWWDSALIKGFGFEYMTRGQALVLGDPGPWLASGMTGGTIYLRHDPTRGLSREYLESRLSSSARVQLESIESEDIAAIVDLLEEATKALLASHQDDTAIASLKHQVESQFLKVVPVQEQVDQQISTE